MYCILSGIFAFGKLHNDAAVFISGIDPVLLMYLYILGDC